MPIYEYRCEQGHTFEVLQRMSDNPVERCQTCEAPVRRVFHPVAIHFKGSGFHNTDYGKARRRGDSEDGGDSGDGSKPKAGEGKGSSDGKSSSDAKGSGDSKGSGDAKGGDKGASKAASGGSSSGS